MHLLVIGLSHKTAPVAQREKASLSDDGTRELLADLIGGPIREAVVLSTCNRCEIYLVGDDPAGMDAGAVDALVRHTAISADEFSCARYRHDFGEAARHLFRVASSLDSMVVGESEIQGQVRDAWERAREARSSGPILNELFQRALETGKRVRRETGIGRGAVSVSSAAVDLARAGGEITAARVLVIGAGPVAESAAATLVAGGAGELVVANRTVASAHALAGQIGGRGVGFADLPAELAAADVVISSTGAPHPILGPDELSAACAPGRQKLVIDISVPRDVAAEAAAVPGIELHDIDDLQGVVDRNLNGRRERAGRGEPIVAEEAERFVRWSGGREAAPVIARLHEAAERIRGEELQRFLRGRDPRTLGHDELESFSRALVSKLLMSPTVEARRAAEAGDARDALDVLARLFALDPARPPTDS